ncbi:hypothetical protein D3C74_335070 [compost metagenome]
MKRMFYPKIRIHVTRHSENKPETRFQTDFRVNMHPTFGTIEAGIDLFCRPFERYQPTARIISKLRSDGEYR